MPPDAETIHGGYGIPYGPRLQRIQKWLKDNGIDPLQVASHRPVYVLAVQDGTIQGGVPWMVDVIVFHQYYENAAGYREQNFITRESVMFQRTVPLIVPFPADLTPDDEGISDGKADGQTAQQAPEVEVRDAREAGVSDRHEGQGEERAGEGVAARNEGAAEEGSGRGHQAVSEPEEDRREPEEEVGGP